MDETVKVNDSNSQTISCDSSKSSLSTGIHFNEQVFNEFQKKIKTEIMNSLYPNVLEDNLDDLEDNFDYLEDSTRLTETFHNEAIRNVYKNESMPIIDVDAIFNQSDLNVSKTNSLELENSKLVVSSRDITTINTDTSISNHEILLQSKLPIPSRLFKMYHNCSEYCAWCKQGFAVLDNPNHIGLLKNVETQNAFLRIEPSLDIVSCICDRCWNFLKRTYNMEKDGVKEKKRHIPHVQNIVTEVNVNNLNRVNSEFKIENMAVISEEFEERIDKNIGIENLSKVNKRFGVNYITGVDEKIEVKNMADIYGVSEVNNKIEINKEFELEHIFKKSVNHIKQNKHSKKKKRKRQPAVTCSVHNCSQYSIHPISVDEYIRIKQIFSQFDFYNIILIESKRKKTKQLGMSSLSVCEEHKDMINVMTTCQLCGYKLNGHLYSEEWEMYEDWNNILLCNNIPLILKPGMFICVTCQSYISNCNSLSSIILEDFQQNVKKRNDALSKSFGCLSEVNIPNIYQESNMNPLNDAAHKFTNSNQVKFTEPLITGTYYFKPYNNEHRFKKSGNKKCNFSKIIDLSTDPKIKYIESTKMSSSGKSIPEINDKIFQTVNKNLNCDDLRKVKIKQSYKELNNSVNIDLLSDNEENSNQTLMPINYYLGKERKKKPNKRTVQIMNLSKKLPDIKSKGELLENNKDNLLVNSTDNTENHILNNFTNDTPIQNLTDEGLVPLHVSSLLDSDENEMSPNFEADENQSLLTNTNSDPLECEIKLIETIDIKTEEIDQYSPVNTNIYFDQNVSNIENNKFNENSSEITNQYLHQHLYVEDENTSDLNEENVSIVKPKMSDQKLYSLNSVDHVKSINRSELRKKLRNVVHQRISNGGIKKQRLNDDYELNENVSHEYAINNNSTEESNVDFDANENNIFQNLNSPTIINVFSHSDENGFNYNSNDIIEVSSDEDNRIFLPIDSSSNEGNFSTKELSTSSIHIDKCYSLDPNYSKRLQCDRTLQRVDDFYSSKISAIRSLSDNENLSENSQECETLYYNQSNSNNTKSFTMSKIDSQNITYDEIEDLTHSDNDQSDSEDSENLIHFDLDESNQHIFENLQTRFKNESDMVMYLMENYRMLYSGELVLSENANPHVSDCIQYHMDRLYQLYGDPNMTDAATVSFINPPSQNKELSLTRNHIYNFTSSNCNLNQSNVQISTRKDVTTTTSTTRTPITVSKISNIPSNSIVITEDELSNSSIESC